MTVSFNPTNAAVAATPLDLITSGLNEIAVLGDGETPTAQQAAWGLEKLQRLIDSLNARAEAIFSHSFSLFNLTANHGPHTIGPGGDFSVPLRPTKVLSASFILNAGGVNPVDIPVKIRDDDWWAANPLKSLKSSVVTDLYYDAAPLLGNLNFYPISNVASPVRLETWSSLAQATDLVSSLGFVQGYWDAIVLSLAVSLCPSYNKEPPPTLAAMQRKAMAIIFANNEPPPRIDTTSGMPGSGGRGRPDFNFLTGMRE